MSGAARVRRPLHGPGVVELAAGSILARGELVVALLLVGGAWTTLVILEATRVAPTLHHHALIETGPPPWVAIPLFLGAWQVMVAAMMVPASLPAIDYVTRAATARVASGRAELTFLAGFFLVWAAFGLGAFLGDMVVHRIVEFDPVACVSPVARRGRGTGARRRVPVHAAQASRSGTVSAPGRPHGDHGRAAGRGRPPRT